MKTIKKMKTNSTIRTIAISALVISISVASFAYNGSLTTGDILKKDTQTQKFDIESNFPGTDITVEKEFKYLHFDVNNYSNDVETTQLPCMGTDYLRFDVTSYTEVNDIVVTELSLTLDFDYLRFDVSNFGYSGNIITELPENEFNYLRFDVSKYTDKSTPASDELPLS